MSDIEMSDAFDLPVCVPVGDDDELKGDRLQHYAEFASRKMAKAAAEAINNHDRLIAENEALREDVERLRASNDSLRSIANSLEDQNADCFEQVAKAEQERDQMKDLSTRLAIACEAASYEIKNSAMPNIEMAKEIDALVDSAGGISIVAEHDAEVIRRAIGSIERGVAVAEGAGLPVSYCDVMSSLETMAFKLEEKAKWNST